MIFRTGKYMARFVAVYTALYAFEPPILASHAISSPRTLRMGTRDRLNAHMDLSAQAQQQQVFKFVQFRCTLKATAGKTTKQTISNLNPAHG
jgi:hypothetical protein